MKMAIQPTRPFNTNQNSMDLTYQSGYIEELDEYRFYVTMILAVEEPDVG